MGISSLPQNTVRALGATQSLIDPISVVKELIDNALDAHATSITVELSQNLLDIIQVKDNGAGVPAMDRGMLARRHCTSKITDETDLSRLGGRSLGFRGEALAHMVEMSQKLTVTTRTRDEPTGAVLIFRSDAGMHTERPTAHQIGSTFRIEGFLHAHPVRQKLVLKKRQTLLTKLHDLSKAYALARPGLRLSVSILKSQKPQESWVFATRAEDDLLSVSASILGQAIPASCKFERSECSGISIVALLPPVTCEKGQGRFLSQDGRPLSGSSGLASHLLKHIKQHQGWSQAVGSGPGFLLLNITCTSPTYDVNIEPAKDDVQFEDMTSLLATLTFLLDQAYPTKDCNAGIEVMPTMVTPLDNETVSTAEPIVSSLGATDKPTLADRSPRPQESGRGRQASRTDAVAFNPWIMAKINSRLSPQRARPVIDGPSQHRLKDDDSHYTGLPTPDRSPVRKEYRLTYGHTAEAPASHVLEDQDAGHPRSMYGVPSSPAKSSVSSFTPINKPHTALFVDVSSKSPPLKASKGASFNQAKKTSSSTATNRPFKLQRPRKDPERDAWFDIPQMRRDEVARKRQRLSLQHSQHSFPTSPEKISDIVETGDVSVGSGHIRSFMRLPPTHLRSADSPLRGPDANFESQQREVEASHDSILKRCRPSPGEDDRQPKLTTSEETLERLPSRTRSGLNRRTKSSMLPLERTPVKSYVQDVVARLPSATVLMPRGSTNKSPAFASDSAASSRTCVELIFSPAEARALSTKLASLLQTLLGPCTHPQELTARLLHALSPSRSDEEPLL